MISLLVIQHQNLTQSTTLVFTQSFYLSPVHTAIHDQYNIDLCLKDTDCYRFTDPPPNKLRVCTIPTTYLVEFIQISKIGW